MSHRLLFTDSQLQEIALLPIPEAIKKLELVTPEERRQTLARCLARLWHGGVHDIAAARRCILVSALDESSKEILSRGLR